MSCEVIIDRITGNSLQYAFIEYEEQKSCEDAYFKMDNVLIDDRRIHVDFSQSVSKYRWKGKGRLEIVDDKKPENAAETFIETEDDVWNKSFDPEVFYRRGFGLGNFEGS